MKLGSVLVLCSFAALCSASSQKSLKTKLLSSIPELMNAPEVQDFRDSARKITRRNKVVSGNVSLDEDMNDNLSEYEELIKKAKKFGGDFRKKGQFWKRKGGREKPVNGGFSGRKQKIRSHEKEGNFSEIDTKCANLTRKFELMCNTTTSKKLINSLWKSVQLHSANKKNTDWKSCCGLESENERMKCFNDSRLVQFDNVCKLGKNNQHTKKCCKETAEARLSCFDEQKQEMCGKLMGVMKDKTAEGMRFSKKGDKWGKMCCHAGRINKGRRKGTAKVCKANFAKWASKKTTLPDFCSAKFVWCCTNAKDGQTGRMKKTSIKDLETSNKRRNSRNKNITNIIVDSVIENVNYELPEEPQPEYPDETGQRIEETMEMPEYSIEFLNPEKQCCLAGANRSLELNGTAEEECMAGQEQFAAEWPQVDGECSSLYMKCCMSPSTKTFVGDSKTRHVKEKKRPGKKGPSGRYRNKDGKLPEGMRMSPSGHYYYVDRARPPTEVRRTMQLTRKEA